MKQLRQVSSESMNTCACLNKELRMCQWLPERKGNPAEECPEGGFGLPVPVNKRVKFQPPTLQLLLHNRNLSSRIRSKTLKRSTEANRGHRINATLGFMTKVDGS